MSTAVSKEKSKIFETVLSSPGMWGGSFFGTDNGLLSRCLLVFASRLIERNLTRYKVLTQIKCFLCPLLRCAAK